MSSEEVQDGLPASGLLIGEEGNQASRSEELGDLFGRRQVAWLVGRSALGGEGTNRASGRSSDGMVQVTQVEQGWQMSILAIGTWEVGNVRREWRKYQNSVMHGNVSVSAVERCVTIVLRKNVLCVTKC